MSCLLKVKTLPPSELDEATLVIATLAKKRFVSALPKFVGEDELPPRITSIVKAQTVAGTSQFQQITFRS